MTDILDDLAEYQHRPSYEPPPGPHPDAWSRDADFPDLPSPSVDHRGEIQHVFGGPWLAAGFVRLGTTGDPDQPAADVRFFELLVSV